MIRTGALRSSIALHHHPTCYIYIYICAMLAHQHMQHCCEYSCSMQHSYQGPGPRLHELVPGGSLLFSLMRTRQHHRSATATESKRAERIGWLQAARAERDRTKRGARSRLCTIYCWRHLFSQHWRGVDSIFNLQKRSACSIVFEDNFDGHRKQLLPFFQRH